MFFKQRLRIFFSIDQPTRGKNFGFFFFLELSLVLLAHRFQVGSELWIRQQGLKGRIGHDESVFVEVVIPPIKFGRIGVGRLEGSAGNLQACVQVLGSRFNGSPGFLVLSNEPEIGQRKDQLRQVAFFFALLGSRSTTASVVGDDRRRQRRRVGKRKLVGRDHGKVRDMRSSSRILRRERKKYRVSDC